MSARTIDGRAIAAEITGRIADETRRLKADTGIVPGLAVVLVGTDPASEIYVAAKGRKAEELGFKSVQHSLPAETAEGTLLALVDDTAGVALQTSQGPLHAADAVLALGAWSPQLANAIGVPALRRAMQPRSPDRRHPKAFPYRPAGA